MANVIKILTNSHNLTSLICVRQLLKPNVIWLFVYGFINQEDLRNFNNVGCSPLLFSLLYRLPQHTTNGNSFLPFCWLTLNIFKVHPTRTLTTRVISIFGIKFGTKRFSFNKSFYSIAFILRLLRRAEHGDFKLIFKNITEICYIEPSDLRYTIVTQI